LTFIRIKEWQKYQHYKERNPPWIKLHRGTLSSETWVTLDDASRVLAVALMLLAAEKGNRIPAKPDYLKRVAYLHSEPDLRPLVEVGFIELTEENGESASTLLAGARPERETEESREEKKDLGRAQARSKRGSRLPEGWEPSPAGSEFAKKAGLDPVRTLAEFRDYWTAASGQTASKLDWDAAWRTWCRKAQDFARNKPSAQRGAYAAPSTDTDERRLRGYAQMIKARVSPGQNFTSADRFKMIRDGLITMEDCEKAGCAA
jgi:hypothetical protein